MKISTPNNINRQACEWIAKLHENDLSESEHEELKAWMERSEENKTELRRMAQRWDDLNALTLLAVPSDQPKATKSNPRTFSLANKQLGFATAAAIALFAIMLWPQTMPEQQITKELKSHSTDIGEQKTITLADNSTVLLNTNSQFSIAYTPEFRDIYLVQGEAHFEVESDNDRPFRVFAGKSKVRAVGTAFSVHLKKTTVDIIVTHGSVAIDSIRESIVDSVSLADKVLPTNKGSLSNNNYVEAKTIVTAGHTAQFDQLAGSIETTQLSDPSYIPAWHDGKLKFSGEPLNQVVEEIVRYSPLSIVILDSELRNLRIGGLFDMGETDKMFEALEKGFGIKVEYINENLVHLSSL